MLLFISFFCNYEKYSIIQFDPAVPSGVGESRHCPLFFQAWFETSVQLLSTATVHDIVIMSPSRCPSQPKSVAADMDSPAPLAVDFSN